MLPERMHERLDAVLDHFRERGEPIIFADPMVVAEDIIVNEDGFDEFEPEDLVDAIEDYQSLYRISE